MKRHRICGAARKWAFWCFVVPCVLGAPLVVPGCGGEQEPVEPVPAEEPAAVEPPPAENEPVSEPETGPDISEVRVPADHAVWAPDYVGVLLGLDGQLYEGYNLATVASVQQALGDQGYYSGEVDSDFDRNTMEAVADFQAENALHLTGIPTPRTRSALRPVDAPPVQSARVFLVQVGVFNIPENAERLAGRLRELGLDVQAERTNAGQDVIRVGPFADRSQAEEAMQTIGAATGLSPFVMGN